MKTDVLNLLILLIVICRIIKTLEEIYGIKNGGDRISLTNGQSATQQDIAKQLGIDKGAYARDKKLLDLIPELQDMLTEGKLTTSVASRILARLSPTEQNQLIEELANDIKENGLINPPVVTPEYELIAGERRLRALKYLDYKQIEVRIMTVKDALHQLKLEISENENRKDFSYSEKMQWAKELEKEYEKIAKKNQATSTGGENPQLVQNFAQAGQSKTRDKVAQDVGFGSGEQYRKAKYVSENAPEEMIKKLDDGQLSINKAYVTLKQEKQRLERDNQDLT